MLPEAVDESVWFEDAGSQGDQPIDLGVVGQPFHIQEVNEEHCNQNSNNIV